MNNRNHLFTAIKPCHRRDRPTKRNNLPLGITQMDGESDALLRMGYAPLTLPRPLLFTAYIRASAVPMMA